MNDEVQVLSPEEFIGAVTRGLPVDGGPYALETHLTSLPRDKVSRAAIASGLRRVLGDPPPELVNSVSTFGDAYDWYRKRVESGVAQPLEPRVRLRPIRDSDVPALYEASTRPETGYRWRYRGATPGFAQFARELFDGVLVQFAVETVEGELCGLVTCYGAQADCRYAYIGFLRSMQRAGKGEVLEGMLQFIQFLFDGWDFRKLYAEVPEYNAVGMFAEDSRAVRVEGRLVEHVFHDRRWWDMLIVALWREDWAAEAPSWLAH